MLSLVAGKYYIDRTRQTAREVIGIDDQSINFISYHLDTGKSDGKLYQTLRRDFLRWADHAASSSEVADLHSRMRKI